MTRHFIPLALDTYFRGNSQEVEFCQMVKAGGNHLTACTAGGRVLSKGDLRLRERELAPVLEAYRQLPQAERAPPLPDPALAAPPKRPVPAPPENGLVIRGYCTYMQLEGGKPVRAPRYYYEENPDRWLAETQSDLLWLTEAEWKSLLPPPCVGEQVAASAAIQKRFFGTLGIDYMEGSVNSLPVRDSALTLTVRDVRPSSIVLALEGRASLGQEFNLQQRRKPNSRGSEVRIVGEVHVDRASGKITRFDAAGVGQAWGNKLDYVDREIRQKDYPWLYGIAWELVAGDAPADRIPPYNLLHYNSTPPYFDER